MRPNGVFNSGFHFLVGNVISVRDTKEFVEDFKLLQKEFSTTRKYKSIEYVVKFRNPNSKCLLRTYTV